MNDELSSGHFSPLRLFATIIGGIVLAEVVAMVIVDLLGPLPYYQITLIDIGIMTVLIFPVLYFLSLRPLILHIDQRQQAEEKLLKAYDELELRVQARTEELRIANTELEEEIAERKRVEVMLQDQAVELELQTKELRTQKKELVLANERLLQGQENLDRAQAVGQIGSWRLDVRRNVLTWSDENHRIFGVPKGTPLSYQSFLEMVHPDDRNYVDIQWKTALADEPYDIEHRILVEGQVKWVREKAYLEFDEDGTPLGAFGITQDITERKRAEVALREASDRFRIVADFTYDWEYWRSPQNYFHYISPSCERITGYPREAFYNDPALLLRIVHPDDRELLAVHSQHELFTDKVYEIEFRIIRPDGGERWIGHACQLVHDNQGQVLGRRASNRDITERKQIEEELRQSEKRFRELVQYAPVGIYEIDFRARKFTSVNDVLCQLSGYSREELLNMSPFDILTKDSQAVFLERMQKWLAGEKSEENVEYRVKKKDGGEIYALLNVTFTRAADGAPLGATVISYDITERKHAEVALRAARDELELRVHERTKELKAANQELLYEIYEREEVERQLRTQTKAMEAAANGILITDPHGEILWANPALTQMTGYTEEELIGQNTRLFKSGKHDTEFYKQLWSTVVSGQVWRGEMINRRKDGSLYDEEQTITPLVNEKGELAHFIAIKHDITERKCAEDELRKSEEKFRTLADWTFDWAYWVDQQGNIVYITPSSEQITGYRPDEFIADPGLFVRIVHPIDQQIYEEHQRLVHNELAGADHLEFRVLARDGSVHWIDHICRPLFGTDNRYLGRRVSNRDITQRKHAEESLELERNKLLNIMDTMPDGVYIVNQQHDIEYINPVVEREFGPVQGRKCYAYFHARTDICPWCKNEEVFNGKTVNWEWQSDKTNKTYDLFDTPLTNPDGSVSKLEIFHDITHRKQAEAELEQRNLELQALSATEHKQRKLAEALRSSTQALAQTLDLDAVINTLMKHARSLVQSDTASVILVEGESLLTVRAVEGFENWIDSNQNLPFKLDVENNPFYKKLVSARRSLVLPDTAREPDWEVYPGTEQIRSWLFASIVVEEKIIGILGLGKTEENYFTEEHVQWVEALVGQAAVAIQNAWLFEQIRTGRERLQVLSRGLVEIQETERRYIARELHDHAGQTLTSLILGLGALEKEANEPQTVRAHAAELKGMTDNVLEDLHRLAIKLRPASLDQLGLVSALEQLIKSFLHNSPLQIRFKAVGIGEDDRLPQEVETNLYRIAQEALTNVIRHAAAQRADVVLERRGDMALILVEDDGKGFDVEQAKLGGHLGLLGMEERTEMMGGKLTVESVPGIGTTLVAEVSYADPNLTRG